MSRKDAHAFAASLAATLMVSIVVFQAGDGTYGAVPADEIDGDEVVIGPLRCTYRAVGANESWGARKRLSTGRLGGPLLASVIRGDLAKADLYEVLQTLELKQKSGTLRLSGRTGQGVIVLREGRPTFAELGKTTGPHAVLELLHWIEGSFELDPQIDETRENISCTIEVILAEAARRTTSERTTK